MVQIGDRVWYRLDAADVEGITQRRVNFQRFNHGESGHKHPHNQGQAVGDRLASGHVAHIGNPVEVDQACSAIVSAIPEWPRLNLRVELDGSDIHWVTAVPEGNVPGTWRYRIG